MTATRRALAALAAVFSLALVAAPAAFADANFVVDSTADPGAGGCEPGGAITCTLREALQLTHEGTSAGVFGDVTIDLDVSGSIKVGAGGELVAETGPGVNSIAIAGPGAAQLTIDGEGATRVFRVAAGAVSISGVTIARGSLLAGGAGILAEGSSSLTLDRVRLADNAAGGPGGGVFLDTTGSSTIIDSEFTGNSSGEDGGGLNTVGPATIERTTFAGNSASLEEDWTESGGGMSATGTLVLLRNSTVTGNEGGGVSNVGGELTIRNSTIAGNGPYGVAGTLVVMQSSILAGNLGAGEFACLGGEVQSQGNNLVEDTHGDLSCVWSSGSGDVFGADPRLGALGFHGGPTQTLPPVSIDSPAINSGENPQPTDQRGFQRPVPDGAANTDVGAVEVQAPALEVADPPSISPDSDLVAGETLTCDPGTWDTDTIADAGFSFAWMAGAEPVGSGATYVLSADDAGKEVTCRVSVDNGVASAEAGSAAVELEAAIAALAPSTLDFGNRRVGAGPSEPQGLTVTNTGGTDLTVSDVTTTNPEFPVDASACTAAPVAPGASCEVAVRFAPAATGVQGSFVTVESNGGEPVAAVSGTATEPALAVAPGSLDFGQQRVGTSSGAQALVATNVGTAPLTLGDVALGGSNPNEFAIASDGCSDAVLDPGEECTVEVSFSPDLSGPRGAILNLAGEDPASVALTGTGTAPVFSAAPASIDFGQQLVSGGPSGARTVTVTNTGTASMAITTVSITGTDAAQYGLVAAGNECAEETLAPAEDCTVEVSFDPSATGPAAATLSFGGEAPGTVELLGTGIAPALAIEPTSLDFGSHLVGTKSGVQAFVVKNTGSAPAQVFTISLAGSGSGSFVLGPTDTCTGATLALGAQCSVDVSFAPATVGAKAATLDVTGAASVSAPLQGTGIVAGFAVTPTALAFGSREVGAGPSPAQTLTVQNTGSGALTIESVTPTGAGAAAYAVPGASDKCTGAELDQNETCTVAVAFDPAAAGPFPASLSFAGNAPGSVPLSGSGVESRFVATPGGHGFGDEIVGGSGEPVAFTIANAGSAPMPLGAIAISGPNPNSFQLVQNGCAGLSLAPGQECGLRVALTPKAIGPLRAQLDVGTLGSLELVGNGVEPPPAARLIKPKGAIPVKANGRIKARITCAAMVSACRSGLTITLRRAPVARWSGSIAAGKTKTVTLRLNKPTRTELLGRGKLKVLGLLGSQAGEQRTSLTLKARS